MGKESEIAWDADEKIEVLTFDLASETFAFAADLVREILDPPIETRVPGSPRLVGSVINFRGRIIPLADLRPAFDLPTVAATEESRVIVIESDFFGSAFPIGIRADRVHEVTTLARAAAEDAPDIGMRWNLDFINGLIKSNGDLIVVPDIKNIFSMLSGCGKLAV